MTGEGAACDAPCALTPCPPAVSARPPSPRRHDRRALALLVQFRATVLEPFRAEYIVNLSPGGLYVATDDPLPKGTLLNLQFPLKDGTRLIEGTGTVVHVTETADASPERPAGMGIAFEQLAPENLELVIGLWEQRGARRRP